MLGSGFAVSCVTPNQTNAAYDALITLQIESAVVGRRYYIPHGFLVDGPEIILFDQAGLLAGHEVKEPPIPHPSLRMDWRLRNVCFDVTIAVRGTTKLSRLRLLFSASEEAEAVTPESLIRGAKALAAYLRKRAE